MNKKYLQNTLIKLFNKISDDKPLILNRNICVHYISNKPGLGGYLKQGKNNGFEELQKWFKDNEILYKLDIGYWDQQDKIPFISEIYFYRQEDFNFFRLMKENEYIMDI